MYTRQLPTNLLWWGLQAGSAALMMSLGMWACRYREMQPISFPSLPSLKKEGKKPNGNAGGAYELVPQAERERDLEAAG